MNWTIVLAASLLLLLSGCVFGSYDDCKTINLISTDGVQLSHVSCSTLSNWESGWSGHKFLGGVDFFTLERSSQEGVEVLLPVDKEDRDIPTICVLSDEYIIYDGYIYSFTGDALVKEISWSPKLFSYDDVLYLSHHCPFAYENNSFYFVDDNFVGGNIYSFDILTNTTQTILSFDDFLRNKNHNAPWQDTIKVDEGFQVSFLEFRLENESYCWSHEVLLPQGTVTSVQSPCKRANDVGQKYYQVKQTLTREFIYQSIDDGIYSLVRK